MTTIVAYREASKLYKITDYFDTWFGIFPPFAVHNPAFVFTLIAYADQTSFVHQQISRSSLIPSSELPSWNNQLALFCVFFALYGKKFFANFPEVLELYIQLEISAEKIYQFSKTCTTDIK